MTWRVGIALLLTFATSLVGCGDDVTDAIDGSAAAQDAAVRDASSADAPSGSIDGSPTTADAATVDAGPSFDAGPSSMRHTPRLPGYMSSPQGFWEYLPPGYAAAGPGSPLIIFMHGLGENGTGSLAHLDRILNVGPPRFIDRDEWPANRPFIVLSPQQSSGCPSASTVDAFLQWALATYNIDQNRVYLTGLSCGAIGTASYLRAHVDTTIVAAAVVISGDMRAAWNQQACDLGRVAIWGIHGDADTNSGTLPDFTRIPMENLIACTAPLPRDPRLNMLPGVGHNGSAWNATYSLANGLDIYQYMLDNHR